MNNKEIIACTKCQKKFIKQIIYYPTKLEDKRESYYCCPYCGEPYSIHLLGNEEVETRKLES